MGFQKKMPFSFLVLISLHLLGVILLLEVDQTSSLKCYTCRRSVHKDKCPNDIGELKTCTDPNQVCYRMYKTALADYDQGEEGKHGLRIGETHKSGCTLLSSYNRDPNATLGCMKFQTYMDFCSCKSDRCNNADLVMESKE